MTGPERPSGAGDTGPARPSGAGDTGPARPHGAGNTGPARPRSVCYAAYGRTLSSDMPLPELARTEAAADIVISTAPGPLPLDQAPRREVPDDDGGTWLVVGQSRGLPVLSFPGVVDCAVDLPDRRVLCHRAAGADPAAVRHALLDHVVPRVLAAGGSAVLHASAILLEGAAVLFAGPSGAGKSTLAARCSEAGHRLLADDAVVLDGDGGRWWAQPSYPGLRLWPESLEHLPTGGPTSALSSGSPKRRIDLTARFVPGVGRHPLGAVALIDRRPGPPMARRLRGSEAFSRLWSSSFDWPGAVVDERALDRVSALAEEACVLELGFEAGAPVEQVIACITGGREAR